LQDDTGIGERQRPVHVLLDKDDRAAALTDSAEPLEDRVDHDRGQAEGELVGDNQARLAGERASKRKHLPFAAGEPSGELVPPSG
jgi:hypothetical protein